MEKDLSALFLDTLKDIYYAEKQIYKSLPKMAKAATSDRLRAAFEKHHAETEGQIEPGERTILLHSGGLPGLFGHPDGVARAGAALVEFS